MVLLTASFFTVCSSATLVSATNTTISVGVRDNRPSSLTITTAIDGTIVNEPTVTVEGTVHNITQIVVYVDGVYSTSMPLASGAGDFTVAFGVSPGAHEVRFTGLDPSSGSEVSQTVNFTYDPGATPGPIDGGGSTPTNDYVNQTIDAAKATQEEAAQQVQKASSSGPLGDLSDIAFTAFKSIDLLSTTDGTGVNKMVGRFTLVTAGLAATVFPWSVYGLITKIRFIPKITVSARLVASGIRVAGVALLAAPFLFIH